MENIEYSICSILDYMIVDKYGYLYNKENEK